MTRPAYLNGSYHSLEGLTVSVMDHGFLFGDGIYELIPVYNRRPRCFDDHMERMARSLEAIGIEGAPAADPWQNICQQLIEQTEDSDCYLYLQVTRGTIPEGEPFRKQFLDVSPTVFAMTQPLPGPPDSLTAITREDQRWGRCHIKSTMLIETILSLQGAADHQADEAILLRDGEVMEGATSNVFAVVDGEVRTPALSPRILPGVTRKLILHLLHQHRKDCREERLSEAELRSASELWISSSTRGAMPVVQLDGQPVGTGLVGPVAGRLRDWYWEYCRSS